MNTQDSVVVALTDIHIEECKKEYPRSFTLELIRDLAERLGLLVAFEDELAKRPGVTEYHFTRVTEEKIDVHAQSLKEAQAIAAEADNRRGSEIHLKRRIT